MDITKLEGWELADELGRLQAEIGELKAREGEIKGAILALRDTEFFDYVEGEVHRATVSDVVKNQVNWKLIAEKLGASRQLVRAHTRKIEYTAIRVFELED